MHYKFIDIGCGHTNVSVDQYGLNVCGLLVEPIHEFCQVLPTSATVLIENCAVTDFTGEIEINVTPDIDSEIQYFPINAIIHKKHRVRILSKHKIYGAESIIHFCINNDQKFKRKVPCMRLNDLLDKYSINSVDQFKIDVEGYEYVILTQLLELMTAGKIVVKEKIIFEYNELSDQIQLDPIYNKICKEFGYTSEYVEVGLNKDIVLTKIK